jgi:cobalt/nickel transport system permease protein
MSPQVSALDPRTRILTAIAATAIIGSTPRGELLPFAVYFPVCLLLILAGRVSGSYLAWRCFAVSPFILLAAGLLAIQGGPAPDALRAHLPAALSVAGKGYAAALLLALLVDSTPLSELLGGLRRLGSPESLNVILAMMYRYTNLLSEEYARMERARRCRTVRPLGSERFAVYGRQLGALILRSWDRAERVHAAMLSRGFTGTWPETRRWSFGVVDLTALLLISALFLAGRLWL